MNKWIRQLRHDPIDPLLSSDNSAIICHTRQDLLNEKTEPVSTLWKLPEVETLLSKQQDNGSFKYPGKNLPVYPPHHYSLLETWKVFRYLVDQYSLTNKHPAANQAAEFLFSCQTPDGDFRGFIANQYATYYTGAITGLLVKAGYRNDARIDKAFQWLLSMRQDDGGWTIPILTHELSREDGYRLTSQKCKPLEPNRDKPFSHNWTGMVLRAFAAHPSKRKSKAARHAAELLASRFFQPDVYASYKSPDYWIRFQYPFWWNHLVSALDSISLIGIPQDNPQIAKALDWLINNQQPNGLWKQTYEKKQKARPAKADQMTLWISLAICRILKRYYG